MLTIILPRSGKAHIVNFDKSCNEFITFCNKEYSSSERINILEFSNCINLICINCRLKYEENRISRIKNIYPIDNSNFYYYNKNSMYWKKDNDFYNYIDYLDRYCEKLHKFQLKIKRKQNV